MKNRNSKDYFVKKYNEFLTIDLTIKFNAVFDNCQKNSNKSTTSCVLSTGRPRVSYCCYLLATYSLKELLNIKFYLFS